MTAPTWIYNDGGRAALRLRLLSAARTMTAADVPFPPRRIAAILVGKERDGAGWQAIAGANGWLCGSLNEAHAVARWLSRNLGLPVREAS